MGKVLMITGASSDIGCHFMQRNYKLYDKIIVHYHTQKERLTCLNTHCGGKLIPVQADMNDLESVRAMIRDLREKELFPDHIVHLAANKLRYERFTQCTTEEINRDIQCSVLSFAEILLEMLPHMAKKKYGKVVVMLSSCTVEKPPKFMTPYVVSKYALLGLVTSLAEEFSQKGININAISPEMIQTNFISDIPEMIVEMSGEKSAAGRNLTVDEVVPTIEYFLSDMSDMVTGQNMLISGIKRNPAVQ